MSARRYLAQVGEASALILPSSPASITMAEVAAPPPLNGAPLAAPPAVADGSIQGPVAAPVPVSAEEAAVAAPEPAPVEEVVSETLYIQNLNERVKIPVLKASLRGLFKSYGEVLDVVAHSNLRMRGQAFVSFESPEIAKKALKEVRGFPLYSKPMVRGPLHSYQCRSC